jgi:hypothetical protein
VLRQDVIEGKKKVEPGCLFLLHGNVDGKARVKHVGFVSGIENGMVQTVEGNTNKGGSREGAMFTNSVEKYRTCIDLLATERAVPAGHKKTTAAQSRRGRQV